MRHIQPMFLCREHESSFPHFAFPIFSLAFSSSNIAKRICTGLKQTARSNINNLGREGVEKRISARFFFPNSPSAVNHRARNENAKLKLSNKSCIF